MYYTGTKSSKGPDNAVLLVGLRNQNNDGETVGVKFIVYHRSC